MTGGESDRKGEGVVLKRRHVILKEESGVAIVVALLMILILSLIGFASMSSSIFETKLSGNKRGSTDAFYVADSGAQSVMAALANFNLSSGYVSVETGSLPPELQTEFIDQQFSAPSLSQPAGVSFADPPQVTIYHSTKTTIPRGLGISAVNFEYGHYIVRSVGKDQLEASLIKSSCEIREKIVRLLPTQQGGR